MDKLSEEGLGEKACRAVLDDVLDKTKRDGGAMNENVGNDDIARAGRNGADAQVPWAQSGGTWVF